MSTFLKRHIWREYLIYPNKSLHSLSLIVLYQIQLKWSISGNFPLCLELFSISAHIPILQADSTVESSYKEKNRNNTTTIPLPFTKSRIIL